MILNIHGFNSDGNNRNYNFLKTEYPNRKIISPTFNYNEENPYNILDSLQNYIKLQREFEKPINLVVGSSIGGFFAYCLCAMYDVKTILINPSLMPFINLFTKYNVSQTICKKYIELFNKYVYLPNNINYEIILSNHDEIIDHASITKTVIGNSKYIHFVEGTHKMELTDEVKTIIKNIIN